MIRAHPLEPIMPPVFRRRGRVALAALSCGLLVVRAFPLLVQLALGAKLAQLLRVVCSTRHGVGSREAPGHRWLAEAQELSRLLLLFLPPWPMLRSLRFDGQVGAIA